jgi:hypothetical protein
MSQTTENTLSKAYDVIAKQKGIIALQETRMQAMEGEIVRLTKLVDTYKQLSEHNDKMIEMLKKGHKMFKNVGEGNLIQAFAIMDELEEQYTCKLTLPKHTKSG